MSLFISKKSKREIRKRKLKMKHSLVKNNVPSNMSPTNSSMIQHASTSIKPTPTPTVTTTDTKPLSSSLHTNHPNQQKKTDTLSSSSGGAMISNKKRKRVSPPPVHNNDTADQGIKMGKDKTSQPPSVEKTNSAIQYFHDTCDSNQKDPKKIQDDCVVMKIPIHIPNTVTAKEAKKIRKESRREVRKLGQDESKLEFIYHQEKELLNKKNISSSLHSTIHHPNMKIEMGPVVPNKDIKKLSSTEVIKTAHDNIERETSSSLVLDKKKNTSLYTKKKSTAATIITTKKEYPRINDILEKYTKTQAFTQQREYLESNMSASMKNQYIALDCEMVGIGTKGKQSALARVSIVDWYGNTLLDTFVQVPQRVTDFRTHVSGIRPHDIRENHTIIESNHTATTTNTNSTTLMDVSTCRTKVTEIIQGKIIVGHALQNDFRALMLNHPKDQIRDTARYPPLMKSRRSKRGGGNGKLRPRKLRDLVSEHVLGMEIQKKGQAHSSVEDATGVMEVYKSVREEWEKYLDEKKYTRKKS